LWRSDEEKIKKLLDSIAQEKGKKRVKHLQRLEKMGAEDIERLNDASQVLISCIADDDEEVWKVVQQILEDILKRKVSLLKGAPGALVPHLRIPGRTRKKALEILGLVAKKKKTMLKDFVPILMMELNTGDQEENDKMIEILMILGINAKEYIKRVMFIERILEVARSSGADITESEKVFEQAKGLMVNKGINEFLMGAKKAELMARYAKKVAVIWRDIIGDIGALAISSNGKLVAAGTKNEVLLYSIEKEILWRFTVEGDVSTIRFTPDDRTILIGTSDRMLYLVNRDSNIQWKRRRGGAISVIYITELTHEIFVSTDDSNISTLNMDGVETSRQWTEKPVDCMAITDDGENIVLTLGDHNIFSYNRNLFQQWKYMGGIWTDLSISKDGNFILAGSKKGDVVCLSGAGIPLWKKNIGGAIKKVFVNPETDCFIVGTNEGLVSFNRTGRVLWNYLTKEPLRTFDTTKNGETIIIGTDKGIYLLENREVYKHFLEELGSSLSTVGTFGIDMKGVEELISKSKKAFANNDYKQGSKYVSDITDLLDKAKPDRGSELLVLAETKLSDARAKGIDVSEGEAVLHRAETLINRGDFDGAILEAKHAHEVARRAESVRQRTVRARKEQRKQEVRKVIDVAMSLINEADSAGVDTAYVEDQLQGAITASDEGEFDQCIFIVKELDEELKKAKQTLAGQTEANYAKAVNLVEKAAATPDEINDAIKDLTRAIKYYESKQSLRRVGDVWELMAILEKNNNNLMMSRTYYQRSINTYFKIGELERVAKIIMDMMRELEGEKDLPIYDVEDAFLIYRDGRLIGHHTMRIRPVMDREILGGMLIAIQNFVEDSLRGTGSDMLNELRYGKTRILIQRGHYLTLALVITGSVSEEIFKKMEQVIKEAEEKYDKFLSRWDGDMDKLWGVKKLFEQSISQF